MLIFVSLCVGYELCIAIPNTHALLFPLTPEKLVVRCFVIFTREIGEQVDAIQGSIFCDFDSCQFGDRSHNVE